MRENKEISIENKRKISRPLINVMKTSESPEKKNRKKPEILIKSRSFNDLLEENREIPMKTPEKLNTLKKPKIMALKSLNLSDFLSKSTRKGSIAKRILRKISFPLSSKFI